MKNREIRIPPLPQTKALSEQSESAFFVSGAKAAPKTAPGLKSSRKRFMRTRQFKNARIVRAANGDWRVVYEYQLPGQTGKFRKFYVRIANKSRKIQYKRKHMSQFSKKASRLQTTTLREQYI